MISFGNIPLTFTLECFRQYILPDYFFLFYKQMIVQLQYQFAPAAERGFSPRAVIRSAGGCQRRGQLPAGGVTVRAAVVSGWPQETSVLQEREKVKQS